MNNKNARVIAFYLPQYHPIPENDAWWGKGFTEWTNVGKAKPVFKGHYQPKVPADLGYYDLRIPEVREAQAAMAKNAGIEGFMYWHYWFGNKKTLLETPFQEVVASGSPDFPFCLGWANHSWENKTWSSENRYSKRKMLIEQVYPGKKDYTDHFYYILSALKDPRYITIDGKPVFLIYAPLEIPDLSLFTALWQRLALENGLKGIYFIGQAFMNADCPRLMHCGLDGICRVGIYDAGYKIKGKFMVKVLNKLRQYSNLAPLNKYNYAEIIENLLVPEFDKLENVYPTVVPNFDHTPRSGNRGLIWHNSTPALFQKLLRKTIDLIKDKPKEQRIVFLRSWNEWGEGNYVEPDLMYGHGYLDAIKKEIIEQEGAETGEATISIHASKKEITH